MKYKILVGREALPYIDGVQRLLSYHGEGMVLPKSREEIEGEMVSGKTVIAVEDGEVLGHQSFFVWPDRKCVEPRAGVVRSSWRCKGLGTLLREKVLTEIKRNFPNYSIVAVASPKSQSIWRWLGFSEPIKDDVLPDILLNCEECPLRNEFGGDRCCHKILVYRNT